MTLYVYYRFCRCEEPTSHFPIGSVLVVKNCNPRRKQTSPADDLIRQSQRETNGGFTFQASYHGSRGAALTDALHFGRICSECFEHKSKRRGELSPETTR